VADTTIDEKGATGREALQVEPANASGLTPIVLIHGLWMTPLAWENWVARYQEMGFAVLTPG
jgi:non-heme chloroperoxidase